jgi:hypothetical protein
MDSTTVQLQNAEYDCGQCQTTHSYSDGPPYDEHQDLMVGNKRWIYEEVTVSVGTTTVNYGNRA